MPEAQPLLIALADPIWRLTSGRIYKIIPNAKQGLIPYAPRPEHVEIFKALIERDRDQLMLLKARRPGFSTALGLYTLDFALFTPGVQCSLIDQNAADATRKLDKIVCVALDALPDWLRARIKIGSECGEGGVRNGEHLTLMKDGGARSDIYAGMNARGGTNHLLWVSEWGVIQYEDEARSAKIKSGALPSARDGKIVVETTWAGGKSGDVWDLIQPQVEPKEGEEGIDDWEIQFCPWWQDPRNTDAVAVISPVAWKYFAKVEPSLATKGIFLTEGQKRWWAKEKRKQGIFMARENPTFLHECWESPAPGSIYGDSIDAARAEDRVLPMPVTGRTLVHTAWDLGAPRQTRVIYFQVVGEWIHIIDIDPVTDETMVRRVERIKSKGYLYGSHYMPHDAEQTERSGYTLATEFTAHWLKVDPELLGRYDATTGKLDPSEDYRRAGIRFVPRTKQDEWPGINYGLQMFCELKFRSPQCDEGLSVLSLYRVPKAKEGGSDHGKPVHDFSSHLADAFRTLFEAKMVGMIQMASPVPPEDRFAKMFGRQGGSIPGLTIKRGPRFELINERR